MGVAVTVIAVDECIQAYKRRKMRKAIERELGLTAEDRREVRRIRRQRQREQREREREFRRHMREAMRRSREEGGGGGGGGSGRGMVWDEEVMAGIGLPGCSPSPRPGVDRAVTLEEELLGVKAQKKRGLRRIFGKQESEPAGKKETWFRRRKRQSARPAVPVADRVPPPTYEEVILDH